MLQLFILIRVYIVSYVSYGIITFHVCYYHTENYDILKFDNRLYIVCYIGYITTLQSVRSNIVLVS